MRQSLRLVGSVAIALFVALWFSGSAIAQGLHQHGSTTPAAITAEDLATSIAHGTTLGAVVFLVGLVAFVALVWLPDNLVEEAEQEKAVGLLCRWMWALVGLLVAAGLVELSLYAVRASGEAFSAGLFQEALFDTRVGQIWVVRIALGISVVTAATYAAQKLVGAGYRWGVALFLGGLLLATLTMQSHAAAEGGFLPFAADWLHVAAASLWMGGLLGFPILLIGPLRVMPPEARAKLLGRVVPHFSKVATIAVMSLILTGLVATLLHVPSVSALLGTPYGRALGIKLGLLVFLLALGAWNLRLRGRGPFNNLVRVELALAIGIFAATGFLTSLPPADAAPPVAPNPNEGLRQPPMPQRPVQGATNTNTPSAEIAANDLVVRVSGTPGTSYSGTYGTGKKPETANNTLGAGFTDYEVEVGDGGVSAAFEKTQPGEGTLKLEILSGGEVVAQRETSEELGTVAVSWSPRAGTSGQGS